MGEAFQIGFGFLRYCPGFSSLLFIRRFPVIVLLVETVAVLRDAVHGRDVLGLGGGWRGHWPAQPGEILLVILNRKTVTMIYIYVRLTLMMNGGIADLGSQVFCS